MNKEQNITGTGELITSLASYKEDVSEGLGDAGDNPIKKEDKTSPWAWYKMVFYAFIFLLPLFFLPTTMSPVLMNKKLLAGLVLVGLSIYILARLLATGKIILPKKSVFITLASLVLAVLLSSILSIGTSVSFQGLGADSFFWVVMYALSFLLAISILKNRASVIIASVSFVLSIGVLGIFSILQFSGINLFPFSFAQSVSFSLIGGVFATVFILAAGLMAIIGYTSLNSPSNKPFKIFLWGVVAITSAVLLQMTSLSSVWISLAVAATVVAAISAVFAMRKNRNNGEEVDLKPTVAPFFIIIVAVLAILIQPNIKGFMVVPAEVSPTASSTMEVMKGTMNGSRMLHGTGPGTFAYSFAKHRPVSINETNLWGVQFNQGYSAFLTYTSNWGVLGGGLLLAFVITAILVMSRGILRSRDDKDNVLLGIGLGSLAVVAMLTTALFIYRGNVVMHLILFISAGIGFSTLSLLGVGTTREYDSTKSPQLMFASSLSAVVLIGLMIAGIYFAGAQYMGRYYLARGVEEFQETGKLEDALAYFDKAVAANSNDDVILRAVAQALSIRLQEIINSENTDAQKASQELERTYVLARNYSELSTQINPHNTQNWIQAGQVYEQVIGLAEGANSLALARYEEAKKYDPSNPSLPLAEARVHILSADYMQAILGQLAQSKESSVEKEKEITQAREEHLNKAIEKLNLAIELKSNYSDARFLMAQTYGRLGDLDKAIEETLQVAAINPGDASIAFQLGLLYYQNEDYDSAKAWLERSISLANGNFANARYYLGIVYYNIGDKDLAIKEFEQLKNDNPDNELVENVLNNLRNNRDPLAEISEPVADTPVPEEEGAESL